MFYSYTNNVARFYFLSNEIFLTASVRRQIQEACGCLFWRLKIARVGVVSHLADSFIIKQHWADADISIAVMNTFVIVCMCYLFHFFSCHIFVYFLTASVTDGWECCDHDLPYTYSNHPVVADSVRESPWHIRTSTAGRVQLKYILLISY